VWQDGSQTPACLPGQQQYLQHVGVSPEKRGDENENHLRERALPAGP